MKRLLRFLVALVVSLALAAAFIPARAQDSGPYRERATLGRGMVRSVAWSADGTRLAVALRNGTVKIWEEM